MKKKGCIFLQWSSWSSRVANWEGSDRAMEKCIGNGDLMAGLAF